MAQAGITGSEAGTNLKSMLLNLTKQTPETTATLKALGAPGSQVVAIHLVEVMLVAIIGVSIGVAVGASLPFILAGLLADVLPFPLAPTIAWTELGVAALYGLVTALVFALLPLGQAHDTPVSALFRDVVDSQDRRPRALYLVAFAAALAAMIGITILFAYDARIATILCDTGFRYLSTIYNPEWMRSKNLDPMPWQMDSAAQ
jgi:putative ABC transport system permease protein